MSTQLLPLLDFNQFFGSMPSTATSPGSPTLTHASSGNEEIDSFLDFAAFDTSNNNDNIMTMEQQQDLFGESQSMQDLFAQYYGQITKFSPSLEPSIPESSINPILLGLPSAEPSIMPSGLDMDDKDEDEDEVEEETTEQPTKKRIQPKRKAQPKRKVKSVADLALPMVEVTPASVTPKDKDAQGHLPHIVFPVPDYIDRPPPEEYAKLSSKEKRQLRNKISARNFRHRRKEYITTLEGEIAQRDSTISALSEEVDTLRTDNKTLRTDLDVLRKTVDELLNKARPSDHSPALLSPEPKFNALKDRSPFASTSTSWASSGFGALPNVNVHTTFIPPPCAQLFAPQRNMNPLMDKVNKDAVFHLPGQTEDDSFFGQNPFTLNGPAMERYRAQLYSKVTHNINGQKAPVAGFKPSFFAPSTSNSDIDQEVIQAATRQTAFVAQEATSTLVRGLMKSFWNTFTGSNPHAAESVADLLAGRAELKIVPSPSNGSREFEDLTRGVQRLSVGQNNSSVALFRVRKA